MDHHQELFKAFYSEFDVFSFNWRAKKRLIIEILANLQANIFSVAQPWWPTLFWQLIVDLSRILNFRGWNVCIVYGDKTCAGCTYNILYRLHSNAIWVWQCMGNTFETHCEFLYFNGRMQCFSEKNEFSGFYIILNPRWRIYAWNISFIQNSYWKCQKWENASNLNIFSAITSMLLESPGVCAEGWLFE